MSKDKENSFEKNLHKLELIVEKLAPYVHVPFQFEKTGSSIALYQPSGL